MIFKNHSYVDDIVTSEITLHFTFENAFKSIISQVVDYVPKINFSCKQNK